MDLVSAEERQALLAHLGHVKGDGLGQITFLMPEADQGADGARNAVQIPIGFIGIKGKILPHVAGGNLLGRSKALLFQPGDKGGEKFLIDLERGLGALHSHAAENEIFQPVTERNLKKSLV